MKSLKCVIRPDKLEDLKKGLADAGIVGMTVSDAKGFGKQKGRTEHYRGAEYEVSFVPKTIIEVVVADAQVEAAIAKIVEISRTGQIGDGKIFVSDVLDVIRIRTGEHGEKAI